MILHITMVMYISWHVRNDAANPLSSTQDAHLSSGNAVQIIGKVNPDLSIRVLSSLDLGTNVGKDDSPAPCKGDASPRDHPFRIQTLLADVITDFNVCKDVVDISQRHRELFDTTSQ